MVLLHQFWCIELRDVLKGVQSYQGTASIGIEYVFCVSGLQAPQDCFQCHGIHLGEVIQLVQWDLPTQELP